MKWNNVSISRKMYVKSGAIITFLVVISTVAILGLYSVESEGALASSGNKLRSEILQREVDHLNWVSKLVNFIDDDSIKKLTIELDPNKCGLGKWYLGEGRKQAELQVPGLIPLFTALNEPHARLHDTARNIQKVLIRADPELPAFLTHKEVDHLVWVNKLQDAILSNHNSTKVELDHTLCGLGLFIYGEKRAELEVSDKKFAQYFDQIGSPHKELHDSGKKVEEKLGKDDREGAISSYRSDVLPALEEVREILDVMQARAVKNLKGKQEAEGIFTTETKIYLEQVRGILFQMSDEASEHIISVDQMLMNASTSRNKIVMLSLGAAISGLMLSFFIARSITNPLNEAVEFNKLLSQGDLTSDIIVNRKDEIGILNESQNRMMGNIRVIVSSILDNSSRVASSSEELSSMSHQLATGAEEMSVQSGKVASASEQMSVNMNAVADVSNKMSVKVTSVASSATEMSVNVNSVAAAIEEMTSTIGEIASNCATAAEKTHSASQFSSAANDQIEALALSAADIGSFINTVQDITEQTKLLALNATIEAARAGESGKGFAVVAGEVKELAKETGGATEKISQQIKAIQDQTSSVVTRISRITEENRHVSEVTTSIATAVEQLATTAADIAKIIADTSYSASDVSGTLSELSENIEQDINRSLNEINAGVLEVTKNIHGVNSVSQETARGTAGLNDAAIDLAKLAANLQDQAAKFRLT